MRRMLLHKARDRVCSSAAADFTPPKDWGAPEWVTPDGIPREVARGMILDCARHATDADLAARLRVGVEAVRIYRENPASIPRQVGERIRAVRAEILKKPLIHAGVNRHVLIRKAADINADAKKAVGAAFKAERLKRGWSVEDFIEALGPETAVNAQHYAAREEEGFLPRSGVFFPACVLFGIDPRSFGFISAMNTMIECWKRERERGVPPKPPADAARNPRNVEAAKRFGEMVREAREQKGVTVKSVAEQIGVLPARLSAIECHGSSPKSSYFFRLCEVLDLKPEDCGFKGEFAERIADWRFRRERERKEA